MAEHVGTVSIELAYDDALRLWVLVHDPANAGRHRADERIGKIVSDAIKMTEAGFVGVEQHGDDR